MNNVGLKVFSASKPSERNALGDQITQWLAARRGERVLGWRVLQSSDSDYHCLTIVVIYEPV